MSTNPNVKIYIGAPASSTAGGGYVDAATLSNIALETRSQYSSFGGVMLWDASQAYGTSRPPSGASRRMCSPTLLRIRSQRPVRPEHQERDPPEWQRGHDLHPCDGIHDICKHDDALCVYALDGDDDCRIHDSSGADEHAIRGQLRRGGLMGRERRVQRR